MSFQFNLIAEYKAIFPELNEKVLDLVEGIPRKIIIQAATTFLGTDNFKEQSRDWRETLRYWFRHSNSEFAENIASRIINNYARIGEKPSIFSPISNLKLLQLGLSIQNSTDELSKSEEQVEIDLFKIYLLLNQSTSEKYLSGKKFIYDNYSGDEIPPLLVLSMGFAVSDVVNYFYPREQFCQSVKAFFLFHFLGTQKAFEYVTRKFCEFYNIKELKEYYLGLLPLMQAISKKEKDGFFEFNILKDDNYEKNSQFISKLAIQKYNPEDDIDYKEIRSQPFVGIAPDTYRITHPIFFSDKIFKGIFFDLSRLNNEALDGSSLKDFRSLYGKEFSEKFLFYELMSYSFNKKHIRFSGDDFEKMHLSGRSDYYLRCANNVFIFEYKEVLINAAVKESGNFADLEKEFRKKFLTDGKNPKAIRQVKNNISFIVEGKNEFDKDFKLNNLNIYPIVVLNDIMFEAAGFNFLLNSWFAKEMEGLQVPKNASPLIKPLVVLSIDTLIQVSDKLRNESVTLKEILDNYYKKLKFNANTKFKNRQELEDQLKSTFLPASMHIDEWMRYVFPKSYPNKEIMEYAYKINGWE